MTLSRIGVRATRAAAASLAALWLAACATWPTLSTSSSTAPTATPVAGAPTATPVAGAPTTPPVAGAVVRPSALPPPTSDMAYTLLGPDGQGWLRVVTTESRCPTLRWDDGPSQDAALRVAPGTVASRAAPGDPDGKAAVFALRVCEAAWPRSARQVTVGAQVLLAPPSEVRRLVLIGDTGCRMKGPKSFQDCNDPRQWPLAELSDRAAALRPDAVVHVGDMHYRESPCPPDRKGCAGSPWGYGDDVWRADFFVPSQTLLQVAPWVAVRGNHESCTRGGQGWMRFLDTAPWSAERSCDLPANDGLGDFSEPFAVPLDSHTQLIVFDSSLARLKAYQSGDPAYQVYLRQLRAAADLAARRPHNFFLNHHPILAWAPKDADAVYPGNAALQSVMKVDQGERLFPRQVDIALHGHVHLFEAINFASDHPATLVIGNSGSAADSPLPHAAAMATPPAPGARPDAVSSENAFGYSLLERIGAPSEATWQLTEYSVQGQPRLRCKLQSTQVRCERL